MDVIKLQTTLGVDADNKPGKATFTALFRKCGAPADRAAELAICAARYFAEYGVMDSALRLAHLMAQLIHESASFHYMEEIASGAAYEGRKDLGNTQPGDGVRYKGRGPIQITGRANYRYFGDKVGIAIEQNPTLAASPSIGLHLALEYWKDRRLNILADSDDIAGITRRINGGVNGLDDRKVQLAKVKGWML